MLILTRRVGETLMVGDDITVTVLGVKGNQVRIGVKKPFKGNLNGFFDGVGKRARKISCQPYENRKIMVVYAPFSRRGG